MKYKVQQQISQNDDGMFHLLPQTQLTIKHTEQTP